MEIRIMCKSFVFYLPAALFFLTVSYVFPAQSEEGVFALADNGLPACSIVVAENPTPAARLAALELQFHVLKITGAMLPVITDKE